jgi:hypothetical protein
MYRIVLFVTVLLLCRASGAEAQQKDSVRTDSVKNPYVLPPEIVMGKNRYKTTVNWFTAGLGLGANKFGSLDGNMGVDFHLARKGKLYYLGFMRGKDFDGFFPVSFARLYSEIHAGRGLYKRESIKTVWAVFAGPSLMLVDYIKPGSENIEMYKPVGLNISAHAIYKPVFDLGIGAEVFMTANARYTVAGLRAVVFLSNAYKGKKLR